MLNNLYRPLEEGTHSYSQIDDYLRKRHNAAMNKTFELLKRFKNGELSADEYIKQNRRNDAFRDKIGKIRDKAVAPLMDRTIDVLDAGRNYMAVRGLNHRKDINKAIHDKYVRDKVLKTGAGIAAGGLDRKDINKAIHDKYVGGKVLKAGAGIAAGGLAIAGIRKYLKEHPDSIISKKIKSLKERFKKK